MGNVTALAGLVTGIVVVGWAASRWSLARCAMRHEGLRRLEACRRSSRLLRGHRLHAAAIGWLSAGLVAAGMVASWRLGQRDTSTIAVVAIVLVGWVAGWFVMRMATERCYRHLIPRGGGRTRLMGGSATTIRHPAASRVHRSEG